MIPATDWPSLTVGLICWARPAGTRVLRRGCCAPPISVRRFVSAGPKSRQALLSTSCPLGGKRSTSVPSYTHMRKWWVVKDPWPPTLTITEPPRSRAFFIGTRTKVHTSRSVCGGTTKRGTLSRMVRRAAAGGAMASAAAAAAAKTKETWRALGMVPPRVANSHRSRQTRGVNSPRAEPSKNVCERSVREGGHYFLNEELEAFPVEGGPECQDDPFRPGRRVLPDALDHLRRRADQDARPHEVGHGAEHQAQALLLPADLGVVAPEGQAQVRGARDGAGVAALALAPAVERGVALREELRGEEGYVPAVGMARHQPEETLLPLPADPQAQPGLHWPRLAERVLEAELPARERDALAVEEGAQGLRRLLQQVEPLLDRRERDAEGTRLDLVPSRADAELAAPAAQVVDGDRRLREQTDRPVADAEDETTDPHPLGLRGERGHGRHPLEGRLRRVGEVRHRVEVVPDRAPVEAALVGDPPQAAEIGDRAVLRAGVDAEAHGGGLLARAHPVAREPELVGERLEPLLGRAEAQLGLLGARRVAVQLVLDHVARAAVELVGGERRLAVGAARPRLRDRDLARRRQPLGEAPERLAGHVPRSLELDRHHGHHLLHRLEGAELHAELLALADVAGRHLEDRVGAADHVGAEERGEPRAHRGEARPGGPGTARERHALLAARDGRQPRALLRRRAERRETESARDLCKDGERRGGAAELLDEQPEVEQRRALPPVGGGQPVAEPAEARDRLPEGRVVPLGGAVPRQAPLARDLGGQEAARRLPDRLLLFRRRELHPYFRGSPSPRCAMMARWISLVPPPKRCIGAVV